ncbi:hypothetical protein M0804_002762 [Polistes exclamans]|nr:hypothetical protein M0804_002762 [Polistes exclamans]
MKTYLGRSQIFLLYNKRVESASINLYMGKESKDMSWQIVTSPKRVATPIRKKRPKEDESSNNGHQRQEGVVLTVNRYSILSLSLLRCAFGLCAPSTVRFTVTASGVQFALTKRLTMASLQLPCDRVENTVVQNIQDRLGVPTLLIAVVTVFPAPRLHGMIENPGPRENLECLSLVRLGEKLNQGKVTTTALDLPKTWSLTSGVTQTVRFPLPRHTRKIFWRFPHQLQLKQKLSISRRAALRVLDHSEEMSREDQEKSSFDPEG